MHGILVSHKCLTKFLNCHAISSTTIACSSPSLQPLSFANPLGSADTLAFPRSHRYMREPLHDPLCLHRGRLRCGWRAHILHPGAV